MLTIHKYPFLVMDRFYLEIPEGAEILSVQLQRGTPCLWAKVDTDRPTEERFFRVYGTGHPVASYMGADLRFLATIQDSDGPLVWHVFEDKGV